MTSLHGRIGVITGATSGMERSGFRHPMTPRSCRYLGRESLLIAISTKPASPAGSDPRCGACCRPAFRAAAVLDDGVATWWTVGDARDAAVCPQGAACRPARCELAHRPTRQVFFIPFHAMA